MTITEITPHSYQTSHDHRSLADAVMQQAGLSPHEVAHLELVKGTWFLKVWLRNTEGKRYVEPGTNVVAHKIVTVDPLPNRTPS